MGWRRTTLAIDGVTQPVDVHVGDDAARLRIESAARPKVGALLHYEGARFAVESVRDMGGRGERFEAEAALAVEADEPAREGGAPRAPAKGKKKGGDA